MAVHRHHRDSDQASPDSADADQSCRRHIQTGLALLSVPVLACKVQHRQQSLQMMSDMRNLRRLHERARNPAGWRDAAAQRGPAVQKTHSCCTRCASPSSAPVSARHLSYLHGMCCCPHPRTRVLVVVSHRQTPAVSRPQSPVGASRQLLEAHRAVRQSRARALNTNAPRAHSSPQGWSAAARCPHGGQGG